MNELVFVKRNDVFTDSIVIAQETDNQHESVVRLISNYKDKFEKMGTLKTSDFKSGIRGPATTYYELNEMQSTFLITLLKNTDKVLNFKFALVQEFYRMRQILMERQTTDWLQTREQGKLIRRDETDVIKDLILYAEEQGSKNAKMFYINYSKLVNRVAGIETGQRNKASYKQLMTVALLEDMVTRTIQEEMERGVYYKAIYKICKDKAAQFARLTYLPVAM